MTEIEASVENARRLLAGFAGEVDRWLMPGARVDMVSVATSDDGTEDDEQFTVSLISTAPYEDVRAYYQSEVGAAIKAAGMEATFFEAGGQATIFMFGRRMVVVGEVDGGVNITMSTRTESPDGLPF